MQEIPKIIHQIWSGIDGPLPTPFQILGETWQENYPDWQYELWDNERINEFILENYPQYWDIYNKYPYNIQRWDAIRYLILYKEGGMYVDFDYESIQPMDKLLEDKCCCFAEEKIKRWDGRIYFNNALMLCTPRHPFMKKIIDTVFSEKALSNPYSSKKECVFNTTGPDMIVRLYDALSEKEQKEIYIIPAKYVTPFDGHEANRFRNGEKSEELEKCLGEDTYAVHYYCSNWAISKS